MEKTNINQPILCFVVNVTFNQMPQRVFTFQDLGKLEQYSVGVFDLEVKLDGLQQDPLHGHHFLLPTNRPVVSCQGVTKHFKQEISGNRIKAGFFNVIIQDIAVHGTND